MLILTQNCSLVNEKLIAYVDIYLNVGEASYPLVVQNYARTKFNTYVRSLGFAVGEVDNVPSPLTLEI